MWSKQTFHLGRKGTEFVAQTSGVAIRKKGKRMKQATCSICGKPIYFIQLTSGKFIPVDTRLKRIRINEGKHRVVTCDGRFIYGRFVSKEEEAAGSGYISHFTTCRKKVVVE